MYGIIWIRTIQKLARRKWAVLLQCPALSAIASCNQIYRRDTFIFQQNSAPTFQLLQREITSSSLLICGYWTAEIWSQLTAIIFEPSCRSVCRTVASITLTNSTATDWSLEWTAAEGPSHLNGMKPKQPEWTILKIRATFRWDCHFKKKFLRMPFE